MARLSVDDQLQQLERLPASREETVARVASAVRHRHYRVVARGAQLAAELSLYELCGPLAAAYERFLAKPAKQDPSCHAKSAIARALVQLDHYDADFYRAGLSHRQPEPVWGGSVDTAVDVRCSCAMGLVASGYSRALHEITELLHDPEPEARRGAVRAIACGNPREAELLLRSKCLAGDEEPAVIGECFSGLLAVAPEESVPWVGRFLAAGADGQRELAALALGESRLEAALPVLREAWNAPLLPAPVRRALLRAGAMLRSDAALDWLGEVLAASSVARLADAIEVLAVYKHDAKLAARLSAEIGRRADAELAAKLERAWRGSGRAP